MQSTRRQFLQALAALGLVGALPKGGESEIEDGALHVTKEKEILGNGTSGNPFQIGDVYYCPGSSDLLQIDPQIGDVAKMWDGQVFVYDGKVWLPLYDDSACSPATIGYSTDTSAY